MSTIVVVRKGQQVCMAADSLTSFGELKQSASYDQHHDKIQRFGDTCMGVVGSAAHSLVISSLMRRKKFTADFSDREAIFSTFIEMHRILKDHYFLNPKDAEEDPYESSQIDALIANPQGIFAVYSLREVYEYKKFWAMGSGADFALGAMFACYDLYDDITTIAQKGVEAGAEFNTATALPISMQLIDLKHA